MWDRNSPKLMKTIYESSSEKWADLPQAKQGGTLVRRPRKRFRRAQKGEKST